MTFSEQLNAVMNHRGLKQSDICRLTGLSSAQVAYLVTGRTRDPKFETVVKIADALDVSLDYLAGRRENPAPRLTHDESVLLSNYRGCTPNRRRKAADAVRDQCALSQGQEATGGSSEEGTT